MTSKGRERPTVAQLEAMRGWIRTAMPPSDPTSWQPDEVVVFVDFWHPGGVSAFLSQHGGEG